MTVPLKRALIGHTGFVGGNLVRQQPFDATFNSSNIAAIEGQHFDLVVCSGIQAKKWWANQHPDEDRRGIDALLGHLAKAEIRRLVLISTIDVYPVPVDVDEESPIDLTRHHAYGKHRLLAEQFVRERFPDHYIVRLPGLFGTGLKKNVIFDLLNDNCLEMINPASAFQYYDLKRLGGDLDRVMNGPARLVNISSEPLPTQTIIDRFFPGKHVGDKPSPAARYDYRSRHAAAFGGRDGYWYDLETVLGDLAAFIAGYRKGA